MTFYVPTPHAEFLVDVALGRVAGSSGAHVRGFNGDVSTGSVPEVVWALGGIYTYSSSADIRYVSSSSASDGSSVTLTVEGLTLAGFEVVQSVTLNGQTPVTLTTPMWRLNKAYVSGSVAAVGNLYIGTTNTVVAGVPSDATTIRGYVSASHQQSRAAVYTVPAGKRALLMAWKSGAAAASAGSVQLSLLVRESGKVFRSIEDAMPSTDSESADPFAVPLVVGALADIEVRVTTATSNNMAVKADVDMLLVTV